MSAAPPTHIAIVGAGVAGLAAAKLARAHGAHTTVLEARPRIGGRALTDEATLGWPWDRGCHWLHCADINPFTGMAQRFGFTVKRTATPQHLWLGNRWADAHTHAAWDAAIHARTAAIAAAGEAGRDVTAADVLPTDEDTWSHLFTQRLAALSGGEPERCSTLDETRYQDTGANWPVQEGYGRLVASWAVDVPVHTNTPVKRIAWNKPRRVELTTPAGTVTADHAILTVPTSVLARGDIAFDPALPEAHRDAAAAVPLGGANKVALRLDRDVFGTGMAHMTSKAHAPEGMAFQLLPFGRPLAIGYLGGRYAERMEAEGPAAMAARAREILAEAFGSRVHRAVSAWAVTQWSGDRWSRGAYSIALPGYAHRRRVLAEPVGARLRLAGEACDMAHFGTVNAAYISGRRAAARALGVPVPADCTGDGDPQRHHA